MIRTYFETSLSHVMQIKTFLKYSFIVFCIISKFQMTLGPIHNFKNTWQNFNILISLSGKTFEYQNVEKTKIRYISEKVFAKVSANFVERCLFYESLKNENRSDSQWYTVHSEHSGKQCLFEWHSR